MKVYRAAVCVGLTVVAPGVALADLPVSAQTLGQLEGIANFCSELNPALLKDYEAQSARLLGKASAQELAQARSSAEYRAAYDSIRDELSKIDREHAAEACNDVTPSK